MKKYRNLAFSVVFLSYILIFSAIILSSGVSIVKAENDSDFSNSNVGPQYSNATIISDGYNGIYWNNGTSGSPSITTDKQGGIHVVWDDATNGTWGTDREIMYSSYTKTTGWNYPLVISDGFEGNYWNDGSSYDPKIDMDDEGNIHVVWYDYTNGTWGSDSEIMYTKFTPDIGWSNVSVISDGFQGSYWNDGYSLNPTLDVDSQGGVHVAWYDTTDGIWGIDTEIMYTKYTPSNGWSNVSIVSDGFNGVYWNDDYSQDPTIAVDGQGGAHVAWVDYTEGPWGGGRRDVEIMYAKLTPGSGWSNVTVITGGVAFSGDRSSDTPTIAADEQGNVYLAWSESPGGLYGYDDEILFSKFTPQDGWSNASIISDGYGGNYWNYGQSDRPSIDVDDQGNVFLVWDDGSDGPWRYTSGDYEIMYSVYTGKKGWTYPLVISDGFDGSYWNHGNSWLPAVAVDNQDGVHVVWWDYTEGPWKTNSGDQEIMYVFVEKMDSSNMVKPGSFTLSTNADVPDEDGIFNLIWTESTNAQEYSIYLIKNRSKEEYATGILDRTYTVIGLSNGTYTFEVKASNDYGSRTSNQINVIVAIPLTIEDTSNNNETQDGDETPAIPFGNYYLGFLLIGVISVVAIVYYKNKKE